MVPIELVDVEIDIDDVDNVCNRKLRQVRTSHDWTPALDIFLTGDPSRMEFISAEDRADGVPARHSFPAELLVTRLRLRPISALAGSGDDGDGGKWQRRCIAGSKLPLLFAVDRCLLPIRCKMSFCARSNGLLGDDDGLIGGTGVDGLGGIGSTSSLFSLKESGLKPAGAVLNRRPDW